MRDWKGIQQYLDTLKGKLAAMGKLFWLRGANNQVILVMELHQITILGQDSSILHCQRLHLRIPMNISI